MLITESKSSNHQAGKQQSTDRNNKYFSRLERKIYRRCSSSELLMSFMPLPELLSMWALGMLPRVVAFMHPCSSRRSAASQAPSTLSAALQVRHSRDIRGEHVRSSFHCPMTRETLDEANFASSIGSQQATHAFVPHPIGRAAPFIVSVSMVEQLIS
ncbi:hypothetical protein K431DRAFT_45042 [Polychaeton citri CBS 116435]|uniref:Uncharacterized protein n=1 Tax=Polychaeton citri CBS 116435 TaxID=1314669 RepID=A0A9P4UR67_9PEZI|nr:hypothetical protein K431DRAFT_45042 [Polychaeton citri CBS 116435]